MAERSLFDLLTDAVTDAIADRDPTMPPLNPPNPAQLQTVLATLRTARANIDNASSFDAWLIAAEDWRNALKQVAAAAFASTASSPATDGLFVRLLVSRLPHLAALLAVMGIITFSPTGVADVDWPRLKDLFTNPETAVNETMWRAFLDDTNLNLSARVPAVLAGLILLAPRAIIALINGNLKVAPLTPPTARTGGVWGNYRTASANWISLTLPIGDPTKATPSPDSVYDLTSDISPDLSATLAFKSDRRLVGGNVQTDFEFWLALAVAQNEWVYRFGEGWFLRVVPGITAGVGRNGGQWNGAFRQFATGGVPAPRPDDPVSVTFGRELPNNAPDLLLGPPYDTRLLIRDMEAFLKIREAHPIVEIGIKIDDFAVVIAPRWFRTFGDTGIFREGIHLGVDFAVTWVEGQGVRLNLSAGLDAIVVVDKVLIDSIELKLHTLRFTVPIEADQTGLKKLSLEIRTHISAQLGPVGLVMNGAGAWVGWDSGAAGFLQSKYGGVIAPTGLGAVIEFSDVVKGGGYLDYTKTATGERWSGAFFLKIYAFQVTAFGIYEQTSSGAKSFIIVIGVRFLPGIQIGYGFSITGFGGLVGINRRADTDALRERLVSGAAGNVLFTDDPIKNAPVILSDLGALFPAADGIYVFGPTIQISWLKVGGDSFAQINVGIFIELPGPTKIVLLGMLQATIGAGQPKKYVLILRLDIVGLIDFPKKVLEFDATLIDSKALEVFKFTGDAAFRLSWGERSFVVLTVGGFYPGFNPEPAVLPALTRVALTLDNAQNPNYWLRFEAYFAVTSNTLQFGGRAEAGVKAKLAVIGTVSAVGFIALDALIQFTPFHFAVAFSAGFSLRRNETAILSVTCSGTITGPGPVVVTGRFCFEILWVDICWSGSFQIGSAVTAAATSVSRLTQALASEVTSSNVSALGGDDTEVARNQAAVTQQKALVSPTGQLSWSQKRAPLDLLLQRFEGAPLSSPQAVVIDAPGAAGGDKIMDVFSPGSFANLSKSEMINRPAFERLQSGVAMGFGMKGSTPIEHEVAVQTFRLPGNSTPPLPTLVFPGSLLDAIHGRGAPPGVRLGPPLVGLRDERWSVRDSTGTQIAAGLSQSDAHQRARTAGATALPEDDVVVVAGI